MKVEGQIMVPSRVKVIEGLNKLYTGGVIVIDHRGHLNTSVLLKISIESQARSEGASMQLLLLLVTKVPS